MDTKVFKLVMVHRMTQSYYDLSPEGQQQLEHQIEQTRADVGAKLASPIYDSLWSNEKVRKFYVVEYPNMNALFEQQDCLEKIPYARYFQSTFVIGKGVEWANFPFTPRDPVAKLVLIHGYDDAYYRLSQEQQDQIWNKIFANIQSVGARTVTDWYLSSATSGLYDGFGIMEYPDIQAAIQETELGKKTDLYRYIHSEVIYGVEQK